MGSRAVDALGQRLEAFYVEHLVAHGFPKVV